MKTILRTSRKNIINTMKTAYLNPYGQSRVL